MGENIYYSDIMINYKSVVLPDLIDLHIKCIGKNQNTKPGHLPYNGIEVQ